MKIGNPDRQYNGQKKKDKKINNYLQNTKQKTKDRSTPLYPGGELGCSGRISSSLSTCAPVVLPSTINPDKVTHSERL